MTQKEMEELLQGASRNEQVLEMVRNRKPKDVMVMYVLERGIKGFHVRFELATPKKVAKLHPDLGGRDSWC